MPTACHSRRRVPVLLEELVKLDLPNLCICVTTRPETDIEAVLNRLNSHYVSLHDEQEQRKNVLEHKFIQEFIN
jgi:hypothetical protein